MKQGIRELRILAITAVQIAKELSGGGVDVVYDPVGGDLSHQALRALAWHGRHLIIGFASGDIPQLPANITLLKEARIVGVWWGTWAARNPNLQIQNMSDIAEKSYCRLPDDLIGTRQYRRFVVLPGSALIGITGSWWAVERIIP